MLLSSLLLLLLRSLSVSSSSSSSSSFSNNTKDGAPRGRQAPSPTTNNETLRLFLVGESGAGKSTLGNALLRADRGHRRRPPFATGDGFDAVTQAVKCASRPLPNNTGKDDSFRFLEVCDTPGLNDATRSDGDTTALILAAMAAKPTHGIVYVHNAQALRLSRATRKGLKRLFAALDNEKPNDLERRLLFCFTRSAGVVKARLTKPALADALCRRLGAFCPAGQDGSPPPALAYAGTHNVLVDVVTFVDVRFRLAFYAWLDGLSRAPALTVRAYAQEKPRVVVVPEDETESACEVRLAQCLERERERERHSSQAVNRKR